MFSIKNKQEGYTWHNLLVVFIVSVGVFTMGSIVKSQIEIQAERKQFLAAQKEVNSLGERIARATSPDKQQAVAYCDYGNVKYGKGGRTCWTQYYLLYNNKKIEDAIDLYFSKASLFNDVKIINSGELKGFENDRSIDFSTTNFMRPCDYIMQYNNEEDFSYGTPAFDSPKNSVLLKINCSGEAKAEHFPVKE